MYVKNNFQIPNYMPFSKDTKQKICVELTLLRIGKPDKHCSCGSCEYTYTIMQNEELVKCHCNNSIPIKQDSDKCVIC